MVPTGNDLYKHYNLVGYPVPPICVTLREGNHANRGAIQPSISSMVETPWLSRLVLYRKGLRPQDCSVIGTIRRIHGIWGNLEVSQYFTIVLERLLLAMWTYKGRSKSRKLHYNRGRKHSLFSADFRISYRSSCCIFRPISNIGYIRLLPSGNLT